VPAITSFPASFPTSSDSPVKRLSSTALLPATMVPSTGMVSPGRTLTMSPRLTSFVSTVRVSNSFQAAMFFTASSSSFLAKPFWSNTSLEV